MQVPASYSVDLGNGFLMNPSNGAVFDSQSGQAFNSVDEFGSSLTQAPSNPGAGEAKAPVQKPGAVQQGVDYASMGENIYDGYNYISNALGSGTSTGGGAIANTGSQAVGTAMNGGTMMSGGAIQGGGQAVGTALNGGTMMSGGVSQGGAMALNQLTGQTVAQTTPYAVGSAANGGTMMSNGAIQGGTNALGLSSAATSGILAAAMATYMAGKNYDSAKSASGGALSKQDVGTMTHMFGVPKFLRKYQAWEDDQWWSPAGMTHKLLGATRKGQEGGARRTGRGAFNKVGLINKDSRSIYDLADGSGFDISEFKKNTQGDAYNINFDDPTIDNDRVNFLNAIASSVVGDKTRKGSAVKDRKTASDLTGELYNASKSNGDFSNNVRSFGDRLGGRDGVYQGILNQWQAGNLTADMRDGYLAAIDKEYGIANPTNQRWDAQLTGKDAERNQKEFAEAEKKRQQQAAKNPQTKPQPFAAPAAKPMAQANPKNPWRK